MSFSLFIAKRLIFGKSYKSTISAPILKIAITAVALSLVMMMVAIATGLGLQRKIREKIAAFHGHIQIFKYDSNASEVSVNPVSIHQDFYPKFTHIQGIHHVQAVASKGGIIATEDTFEGIIAKGVGADYRWDYLKEYLVAGRLPDYKGERNQEVLISRYLANRLRFRVGDRFQAFFLNPDAQQIPNRLEGQIVGIYDSGFQEFDATYIFTDLRHIQRMNRWKAGEVGNFEVFIGNFNDLKRIGNEVYAETLATLDSQTLLNTYYYIFEWLSLFDFNIFLIIGIMIVVGGINMITALLVVIIEKTPMIGVLKAMGATNWSIRKLFLYHAAYILSIGIFWGNVIGLGLLFLQQQYGFIKLDPATYYVTQAPVYFNITHLLLLNIGTLVLCIGMLVGPSFVITRISPVKALRFN